MRSLLLLAALITLPAAAQTPATAAASSASTEAPRAGTPQEPPPASPSPAKAAPAPSSGFLTVYGIRIHYLDTGGPGPVVVLIHGMGNEANDWMVNIPSLAGRFRIIALDLPGYGKSDKPLLNYRVGLWVDHLDEFLRELKIESASIVGASLGGWIGAAFTLAHPEKVQRLVLVSSGGYSLPPEVGERELRLLNPSTREQVRQLLDVGFHSPMFKTSAAVDLVYARRMTAGDGYTNERLTRSVLLGEDVIDRRFREITVPTLIVWGREDRLTPLGMVGEQLHRDLPGSKLVVIDGAGHIPQIEQAKRFNEVVAEFLGEKR